MKIKRRVYGAVLYLALGALAVVAVLIAAVKRLFDKHYGYAYYGALGLLLTSVVLIYPGIRSGWALAIDAALFAACFIITYFLCKLPTGGESTDAADIFAEIKSANRQKE